MSEENFRIAITDQFSDLYWDEDLLHDMYEAVTGGEQSRRFVISCTQLPEAIYKVSIVFLSFSHTHECHLRKDVFLFNK